MKNTILSKKDIQLIEKAIIKHGRILNVNKLMSVFEEVYSTASAHNRINQLSKSGWLKRIKQGMYLITDSISTISQNDVSIYIIANSIVKESYISLSSALNYYQMHDQYEKIVTSITNKKSKKYNFNGNTYIFSKVKNDMYFGFVQKRIGGKLIKIAEAEKALIDYLYLNQEFSGVNLIFEKLKNHHQEINLIKLQEYAIRSNTTIIRKIGFMLDVLNLNSERALNALKNNNKGTSRFTSSSKLFNAKWRIYYDDRIIR